MCCQIVYLKAICLLFGYQPTNNAFICHLELVLNVMEFFSTWWVGI